MTNFLQICMFFSVADILQMKLVRVQPVGAGGVLFSRALTEYFVMENRCSRPVNVLNGAPHSSLLALLVSE